MLASQQINTVKPPDKKPGISEGHLFCVGVALKFNSFGRNCVTAFPWPGCSKSILAYVIHRQNAKVLRVFAQDMPYGLLMVVL